MMNNKKNKIAWIILVIALVAIVAGVIYYVANSVNEPKKATETFFEALKSGDFDTVEQYISIDDIIKDAEEKMANDSDMLNETEEETTDTQKEKEEMIEIAKPFYSDLTYTIKNVEKKGKEANVEVEVTAKDMSTIMQNFIGKVFTKAFSSAFSEDTTEEEQTDEALNMLKESIEEASATKTVTNTITLKKEDGKWKIENNDKLKEVLFPGADDLQDSMNNLFSESDEDNSISE